MTPYLVVGSGRPANNESGFNNQIGEYKMTYNEFIQNIIDTRGRFGIPEGDYKERHHIIPKCIGGLDELENLIDLYAQEHYDAHKMLFEENPKSFKLGLA